MRPTRRVLAAIFAVCVTLALVLAGAAGAGAVAANQAASDTSVTYLSGGGTDDPDGADQLARTADTLGVDPSQITTVPQIAAFGVGWDGKFVIPLVGSNPGHTYNSSAAGGTVLWYDALANAPGSTEGVGHSQAARSLGDALYLLAQSGQLGDRTVTGYLLADPRFPNTGLESVWPSIIPGISTNGPRDPADYGGVIVVSRCLHGDFVCGGVNPLGNPVAFIVYVIPAIYIHGQMYDTLSQYDTVKTWQDGSFTYEVKDAGNPWGAVLRDIGLPVPREFDAIMDALVPMPLPGERSTVAGFDIPTPRELQEKLYGALGWTVSVTAPDKTGTSSEAQGVTTAAPFAVSVDEQVRPDVTTESGTDESDGQVEDPKAVDSDPEPVVAERHADSDESSEESQGSAEESTPDTDESTGAADNAASSDSEGDSGSSGGSSSDGS